MTNKHFIKAEDLQQDAFKLGVDIIESGFHPTFIVAIWRGGAVVGAAIQELMSFCNYPTDHIAIRTSSYEGIAKRSAEIKVHGLHYLTDRLTKNDRLLLVDDVHDTGLSLEEVVKQIHEQALEQPAAIKTATLYYKPKNSQAKTEPDYYLHKTDQWLVFPHELEGLTNDELITLKPGISSIKDWLINHQTSQ